jgi:hypothetical protein
MSRYDRWDYAEDEYHTSAFADAGMGALRITLLFGSAAIALALIVVPIANKGSRAIARASFNNPGIDTMETGSISNGRQYTIRRSVLQTSPNAICVINGDGSRAGDCN